MFMLYVCLLHELILKWICLGRSVKGSFLHEKIRSLAVQHNFWTRLYTCNHSPPEFPHFFVRVRSHIWFVTSLPVTFNGSSISFLYLTFSKNSFIVTYTSVHLYKFNIDKTFNHLSSHPTDHWLVFKLECSFSNDQKQMSNIELALES